MIFVTVGTERFPFDRLIQNIESLQDELDDEELFIQTGHSQYTPSCPHQQFLDFNEFKQKLSNARIVVAHAGAGTLLMCKQMGKTPIMMPRRQSLGEHVDNHQQMLADIMFEQGSIIRANTLEELRDSLYHYDEICSSSTLNSLNESHLKHSIKDLINRLNIQENILD